MEFITFDYTSTKNKATSGRKVIVTSKPSDKILGIDVTELDEEQVVAMYVEMHKALEEYKFKMEAIREKYDSKHSIRQFFPDKMTNVKTEALL